MSESLTVPETRQILDVLQSVQGEIKAMGQDIQDLTIEVKVNQAKTDERFTTVHTAIKALNEKVDNLKDNVTDLPKQQQATDNKLLGFVFTGFATALGLPAKVIFLRIRLDLNSVNFSLSELIHSAL